MASLSISEIFHSIQGEGSRSGLPCVFVRLQGCGLRCSWCDTPYALDFKHGGTLRELEGILADVARYGCTFVELTGGEPLEQDETLPLITILCDAGYTVAVETGGHVDIGGVDPRAVVIMDIKCPGSLMSKRNRWENIEYLKPDDEVKFVIAGRADYEWARDIVREHRLTERCGTILFSPVFGSVENRDLAEWILADRLQVRFSLQIHKHIWDPDARGV